MDSIEADDLLLVRAAGVSLVQPDIFAKMLAFAQYDSIERALGSTLCAPADDSGPECGKNTRKQAFSGANLVHVGYSAPVEYRRAVDIDPTNCKHDYHQKK